MSIAVANRWIGFPVKLLEQTGLYTTFTFDNNYNSYQSGKLAYFRRHSLAQRVTVSANGTQSSVTDREGSVTIPMAYGTVSELKIDDTISEFGFSNVDVPASIEVKMTSSGKYLKKIKANGLRGIKNLSSLAPLASSSLTELGDDALYGSTGSALANLTWLPRTCKTFGNRCFSYSGLASLSGMPDIGEEFAFANTFWYCGSLTSLTGLPSNIKRFTGYGIFSNCAYLTSISGLPSGATQLGMAMFSECTRLASLTGLPSGVTTIPSSCFQSCSSLTTMNSSVIPNVTRIDSSGFSRCTGLTSVSFTHPISVGTDGFRYCSNVTSASFSGDGSYIGPYCFNSNTNLTTLNVTGSGIDIGTYAFAGCTALANVNLQGARYINSYAFRGCTALSGELTLRDCVEIWSYGMYICRGLTKLVANKVLALGQYALAGSGTGTAARMNLTEIYINDVYDIRSYAFRYCTLLTRINMLHRSYKQVLGQWKWRNMSYFPWGLSSGVTIYCRDGRIRMTSASAHTDTQTSAPTYVHDYDGYSTFKASVKSDALTVSYSVSPFGDLSSYNVSNVKLYWWPNENEREFAQFGISDTAHQVTFEEAGTYDFELDDCFSSIGFANSALKLKEFTARGPLMGWFMADAFEGQDELTDVYLPNVICQNAWAYGTDFGERNMWGAHDAVVFHCSNGIVYGDGTKVEDPT